ncbi:Na+/H+ antiporter subunit E [Paeniglutamicibacter cryotolerans]|uniref:Multicomponent Na+:H+ antiporter subunit E n=1 Tax=Paeniglutamicibacter cryotolerans TaxID=670079 RepID=A0A839QIE3_9MICC|nr:Na+/H+ antiporter subunit E [Paeniglutamicibacter cryotolerans]MBB2994295.1 multicomponent Na+:H+ antiporter subunit E [Paeniglutamicibacter cryotolerans]
MSTENTGKKPGRTPFRIELPLLIGMTLFWGALWQDFAPGNLVFGFLISWALVNLFRLPPVILSPRFNIWRAFLFLLRFIVDVAAASFSVLFLAVFRGPKTRSAILAVPLRTEQDLMVTAVGHVLTLIPGSFVVEVDRRSSTLYLHFLNVNTPAELEKARAGILDIEARLIRVMGTPAELAALNAETAKPEEGKNP